MKKLLIITSLLAVAAAQADVIAVIDGGGPTSGDLAHANIVDLSTGGDDIGAMTGAFATTGSGWRTGDQTYWNDTEWGFAPNDGNSATWTFGNMTVGSEWAVFSTWKPQANRSQEVPYTIQGGADILVNQEPLPTADLVLDDGTASTSSYNFQEIGTGFVNGAGELVVTLSSAPDTGGNTDWVVIDAVAIQAIPEPATLGMVAVFGGAILFIRRNMRN